VNYNRRIKVIMRVKRRFREMKEMRMRRQMRRIWDVNMRKNLSIRRK